MILFGLHTMGVLRIGWLYSEKRVQVDRKPTSVAARFSWAWRSRSAGRRASGRSWPASWPSPASQDTVGQGVQLLAVYSLGLGVPFLITALAINQFFAAFARIRRYYHTIEVGLGRCCWSSIGVLIFTDQFTIIARWLHALSADVLMIAGLKACPQTVRSTRGDLIVRPTWLT